MLGIFLSFPHDKFGDSPRDSNAHFHPRCHVLDPESASLLHIGGSFLGGKGFSLHEWPPPSIMGLLCLALYDLGMHGAGYRRACVVAYAVLSFFLQVDEDRGRGPC